MMFLKVLHCFIPFSVYVFWCDLTSWSMDQTFCLASLDKSSKNKAVSKIQVQIKEWFVLFMFKNTLKVKTTY